MKVSCPYCGVSCTSPTSFCQHVAGQKHRANLERLAPEELEQMGRLQYFIDKYLKTEPILGLEYVVEREVDSSYLYTCLLCHKEHDWREMVPHVLDVEHMESYINRHHKELNDSSRQPTRELQVRALVQIAKTVYELFGRRKIRIKKFRVDSPDPEDVAGPSSRESDKKNGALPTASDDEQMEDAKEETAIDSEEPEKGLTVAPQMSMVAQAPQVSTVAPQVSEHVGDTAAPYDAPDYCCRFCGVHCTSALTLCEHIMGKNHFRNVQAMAPKLLKDRGSLSHFLRTYLREEPILGLEYITETRQGTKYTFSCLLCDVSKGFREIVDHITDVDHTEGYIKKHHADLLLGVLKLPKKTIYMRTLREIAMKILEQDGRKAIQVKKLLPQENRKLRKSLRDKGGEALPPSLRDSGNTSHSKRRPSPHRESRPGESKKMLKKSKIDDPPLSKRTRRLPEDYQGSSSSRNPRPRNKNGATLESTTAEQELEFRTNDQLLEYLANFVIDDQEDASYIQKITQNCINALKRFREDEAKREKHSHRPQAPVVHTSRVNPKPPDSSGIKTESHSSSSEPSLPTHAPHDPLGIPKTEVTEFFFNSIKNMDESEVVGVFQKIAATNPEFQRMNIPAVIGFLKDSGRLKKS